MWPDIVRWGKVICPLVWVGRPLTQRPRSVDRPGLSLRNLRSFREELSKKRVDLHLHPDELDTRIAAGRTLLQMCGVFAEFERSLIRERVVPGWREPSSTAREAAILSAGRGTVPSAPPDRC